MSDAQSSQKSSKSSPKTAQQGSPDGDLNMAGRDALEISSDEPEEERVDSLASTPGKKIPNPFHTYSLRSAYNLLAQSSSFSKGLNPKNGAGWRQKDGGNDGKGVKGNEGLCFHPGGKCKKFGKRGGKTKVQQLPLLHHVQPPAQSTPKHVPTSPTYQKEGRGRDSCRKVQKGKGKQPAQEGD